MSHKDMIAFQEKNKAVDPDRCDIWWFHVAMYFCLIAVLFTGTMVLSYL